MSKKFGIVVSILSIIAIIISVVALVFCLKPANTAEPAAAKDVQYVMYLGTNDKDTNQPVYSEDESKKNKQKEQTERRGF